MGIDAYRKELNEKISILETLLVDYDDGLRKGFFCLAVNLWNYRMLGMLWSKFQAKHNPNNL